jgi:hypothetical protein
MKSSRSTGPTVPGWIREEIARHEQIWPLMTVIAGMAATIVTDLVLGALIWTSESVVYYARP